jgi:sortase A
MNPVTARTRALALAASVGGLLLLAACGGDSKAAPTTVAATTTSTTTTSTTTLPPTTTEAPTTTTEAPTTTESLPVPSPPPNPHAAEPKVQIGSIEIPKLGVSKDLLEGVSLTVLNQGPGHWPGTAMPGHRGNAVIAGHRTSHDRPFRHIDQLVPGDDVILTTQDGRFVYKVTSTEIVLPTAIRIISQSQDNTATLFACNPPGSTRQRIVIHLKQA